MTFQYSDSFILRQIDNPNTNCCSDTSNDAAAESRNPSIRLIASIAAYLFHHDLKPFLRYSTILSNYLLESYRPLVWRPH